MANKLAIGPPLDVCYLEHFTTVFIIVLFLRLFVMLFIRGIELLFA